MYRLPKLPSWACSSYVKKDADPLPGIPAACHPPALQSCLTVQEVDGLCASEDGVLPTQGGSRRMAELHYKLALARQFMDEPEAALGSVKAAIGILEKIVAGLRPQPAEPPSFSFGLPDSPDAAAADASADAPEDPQVPPGWSHTAAPTFKGGPVTALCK